MFGHLTFFVASLVFMKGASCCAKSRAGREKNGEESRLNFARGLRRKKLPCIYALCWLVFIASYACKPANICFQGTKYASNREDVVYLHSTL